MFKMYKKIEKILKNNNWNPTLKPTKFTDIKFNMEKIIWTQCIVLICYLHKIGLVYV